MRCDKCNGVGAYSFKPEPTEAEHKSGTSFPSMLPSPINSTIRLCEKCEGTGETAEDIDDRLKRILTEHGKDKCHECQREIDRGDVAWNTGNTEAGTPYSVMQITCQECDTEIFHANTWYEIETFEEFVGEFEEKLTESLE